MLSRTTVLSPGQDLLRARRWSAKTTSFFSMVPAVGNKDAVADQRSLIIGWVRVIKTMMMTTTKRTSHRRDWGRMPMAMGRVTTTQWPPGIGWAGVGIVRRRRPQPQWVGDVIERRDERGRGGQGVMHQAASTDDNNNNQPKHDIIEQIYSIIFSQKRNVEQETLGKRGSSRGGAGLEQIKSRGNQNEEQKTPS